MAVSTPSVNPLPKCQSIGLIAACGGRQILAQPSGPTRTKCGRQKILIYEAVATQLPAVAPFDFTSVDMMSYGVCELCVRWCYGMCIVLRVGHDIEH